jgi:LEA14-like dessication related protein
MNPVIVIGLVIAGLLVFARASTAGAASQLNYVIDSVKVDFRGIFKVQVDVIIGIQNPTSTGFTVNSLSGNISINGYSFGNVSNFTSTYITPNSQTLYTVTLQVPTVNIPGAVLTVLQDFKGIRVDLDATVNVDSLTVPLQLTYNAGL